MVIQFYSFQGLRDGNHQLPNENPHGRLEELGFTANPLLTFDVDIIHIDVYMRGDASRTNSLGQFLVFTSVGPATKVVSCADIFELMAHIKPSLGFIQALKAVRNSSD